MGGALVERLLALTDDVPDRLAQTRCAAMAWAKAETPNARITSELFVITQHGLMYAAGLNESRRALYYLATLPALFDPFVDQVDTAELREGAVVVVDSRFGRDLASAHPMDAALRRILDEHLALRVDLPAYLISSPRCRSHVPVIFLLGPSWRAWMSPSLDTLTSDEAADQPAPAVCLATERRESDGRFARR